MRPVRTVLLILAVVGLGLGCGLALFAFMGNGSIERGPDAIPVTIGELRLNVPQDYFRGGSPPRTGHSERIDLVLRFPDMAPAGAAPMTTQELLRQDTRQLVFLSVLRVDGIIDPADRPQDLYGRFLEPDTWQNPGGLVLRRFEAGSPYEDEELFLAPPDGKVFAARCRKAGKAGDTIGEACLWRFRQSGADLQVRFSPELLPQWEDMAMGIGRKLAAWASK